jgi:PAS domain S-box-containing protein
MSGPENYEQAVTELEALRHRVHELEASQTRLKQAEEELQASEKKYRTIFENTGAATILIDPDTTITMANTEFEKLTGFSRVEIEGKMSWVNFIHHDDRARMVDYHHLRRMDPAAAPRNYECRFFNRQAKMLFCYLTVAVLPNSSQSIASFLDITEMREAERALKAQQEQYRLLVETMNDGIGVQDAEGVITYVNDRVCEMLGYGRDEIIGRQTSELLNEASKGVWLDEMAKRKVNQYEPYEVTWQSHEGELIHTIVSPRPMYDADGNYIGSFAVFTDITNRKKAEEALRLSEEKFAKAFRSSPDAVTITTLKEGRFLDVNEGFLKITGYTRSEVIDHTSIELGIWPSPEFRRDIMAQVAEKGGIQDVEVEFGIKSGEKRKIVYSAESIDLQGVPCLISIFADVTEQRRLEREILDVGERERQKIGQDLHDDLQQHLIGVEALALLLEKRLEQKSKANAGLAHEMVALIREAITKTRTIARGLSPVYIGEGALFTAIRDLAKQVESIFGVSFRLDVSKAVQVKDNAAAVHIFRIIQEAVNNAVRHGRARHVAVSLKPKKGRLTLTISDDGLGMPDDIGEKKGLGLSIMHHRARMIGADLVIKNNPKGGTSVICQLAHAS